MNEGTMVPGKIPSSNKRGYKMFLYSNRFTPGELQFDHTAIHTNAQYLKKGERFRDLGRHYECQARVRGPNGRYRFHSKLIREYSAAEYIEYTKTAVLPPQNPDMRKWKRGETGLTGSKQ